MRAEKRHRPSCPHLQGSLCSPGPLSPSCCRVRSLSAQPSLATQLTCLFAWQTMAPFPKRPFTRVCSLQPGTWLCPAWQPVTRGHRWLCQPGRPECTWPLLEQAPGRQPCQPCTSRPRAAEGLGHSCTQARPSLHLGGALGHSAVALTGDVCLSCGLWRIAHVQATTPAHEAYALTARVPPHLGPFLHSHLQQGP